MNDSYEIQICINLYTLTRSYNYDALYSVVGGLINLNMASPFKVNKAIRISEQRSGSNIHQTNKPVKLVLCNPVLGVVIQKFVTTAGES